MGFDTERAEVDLKSSLSLLRVHLKQFDKFVAQSGKATDEEKHLIGVFHFDLARVSQQAKEINNKVLKQENQDGS